jgi:hypothetical protein
MSEAGASRRRARGAVLLAALLAAATLPACTLVSRGGRVMWPRAGTPAAMGSGLNEYRVAFHVHCYLSHDSEGTIEEIAEAARNLGLDTVILNDHYEAGNIARAPRGVHGDILFIPGVEMRGGGGSIFAFPLRDDFPEELRKEKLLAEFTRQGAVTVLGHVETINDWSLEPFQVFEVYNLHAEFSSHPKLELLVRLAGQRPDAFFESSIESPKGNLARWDRQLVRGRKLGAIAGHDAHQNIHFLGATIGTYQEMLRLFSTHVLAEEWTEKGISEAIRNGRTFVVFEYLASGVGFAMSYGKRGASASGRAIPGDEVPHEKGHTLEVRAPDVEGPVSIRIVRNGQPLLEADARRVEMALPGPGVYRSEVYLKERMWIISSPIYVGPPGARGEPEAPPPAEAPRAGEPGPVVEADLPQ